MGDVTLENETWAKEIEWMLEHEYDSTVQVAKETLEEALRFIDPPIDEDMASIKKNNTKPLETLSFEIPRVLEGFVKLDDCNIVESKVAVKSPKVNKGHVIVASVASSNPWKLPQLKNLKNLLQLSIQEIDRSKSDKVTLSSADALAENLLAINTRAQDQFLLNNPDVPKSSQNETVFFPSLPSNLNIQYEFKGKYLVVTAFIDHGLKKKPKPLEEADNSDNLRCQVVSKKLVTLFSYLEKVKTTVNTLREKIASLS